MNRILLGKVKIEHFINEELDDYSYFKIGDVEQDDAFDEDAYFKVLITSNNRSKELHLFYDEKEDEISIALDSDLENFEVTNNYDWRAKHFWMALLTWD